MHDVSDQELGRLWETVRERLEASVPASTFKLWLEPLRAVAAQGGTLYLSAPEGIRAWVERRYAGLIAEAAEQAAGALREVSFALPAGIEEGGESHDRGLNPQHTFDRFVIGDGNRLAHGAALAVAEAPAEAYNPLFLHGPPGLGKTHLLGAIGKYLAVHAPSLSVRYTTAEAFTTEFVHALHASGVEEFKHAYRDLDVLLIDDVQFLEGKHHTEEEFFHTFNALYEGGSQIVLSADRLPSELSTLASRLRDRFEWGLTLSIEPPNLATRLTVLGQLVREAGIDVNDRDALAELARRIPTNVRQLRGALTRVLAQASLMARPVSPELVAEVLPGPAPAIHKPRVEEIQAATCQALAVSHHDLVGPSRRASALRARQVAIYLTRELTDLSLPQIGRNFGGRDHSTILNALRKAEQRVDSDPDARRELEAVHTLIHSRAGVAA